MPKKELSILPIAWSKDHFVYGGEPTHGRIRHEVAVRILFVFESPAKTD